MPLIVISNLVIELAPPPHYVGGYQISAIEAQVLNELWLSKFNTNLKRFRNLNNALDEPLTDAELTEIQNATTLDTTDLRDSDPIQTEAVSIASERIVTRLAAEGLPPPSNLTLHATELAKESGILALARTRVEARLRAGILLATQTL